MQNGGGRGRGRGRPPCHFFNKPGGCRKGDSCTFLHSAVSEAAVGSASVSNVPQQPSRDQFSHRDQFRGLARKASLGFKELQTLLKAAIRCLDERGDSSEAMCRALGGSASDGTENAVQHLGYIASAWKACGPGGSQALFTDLVLPLLRVLTHSSFLTSIHGGDINTALAFVKQKMGPQGLLGLSSALQKLKEQSQAAGGGVTKDTLAAADACVAFVHELCERLQAPGSQDDGIRQAVQAVVDSARALLQGQAAPEQRAVVRRLQDRTNAVCSLLQESHQLHELLVAATELRNQRQAQQQQRSSRAAQLQAIRSRDPDMLPGHLRPLGPRHSNDWEDFTRISIMPTPDELLCIVPPYLPPNKPGSMPHLDEQPVRALLERHFRLLRHDVVGPVAAAVSGFAGGGGLRQLQQQDMARRGRLQLGGDTLLHVFRRVAFQGLKSVKRAGLVYQVSFDPPSQTEGMTQQQRYQWWTTSRRLAHGTLCVLWSQPDGLQGEPVLLLASVADRTAEDLSQCRPVLGLRLCEGLGAGAEAALKSWLAAGSRAGEIIMLQENNAFFAYEPILRALQQAAGRTLPMQRYLAPPVNLQQTPTLAGASRREEVDAPPYAQGHLFDLTPICDKAKLENSSTIRNRLQNVNLAHVKDNMEVRDALVATSTLDNAQAWALLTGLSQELAVVQGPPGTGKTFLAIQLMRVLLSNTRGEHDPGFRPRVGPILVVCLTNHALDSFLEGLLDVGIESIIRVGSQKKTSERLQAKNLSEVGEQASGGRVGALLKQRTALMAKVEPLSDKLASAAAVSQAGMPIRSLRWSWGQQLMASALPYALYMSFFEGMIDEDDDWEYGASGGAQEWTTVGRGGRAQKKQDLLQDWLNGDPTQDWTKGRLLRWEAPDEMMGFGQEAMGLFPGAAAFAGAPGADSLLAQLAQLQLHGSHGQRPQARGPPEVPPEVQVLAYQDRDVRALLREESSVWQMSRQERRRLAEHVMREQHTELFQEMKDLERDLAAVNKRLQAEYDATALKTLQKARVVGMTTAGAASQRELVASLGAKVLVVEEAAEVLEAHVLSCLTRSVEHLILIGDHEQLRPKPNVYELQAFSRKGLDLDVSLFERLVNQQGFPVATLEQQRRMLPLISRLVAPIYPGLRDHESVLGYPPVKGMSAPLFFLDHDHQEGGADENRSKFNPWEADFMVGHARYLIQQGYKPDDIVLLVPYVGQLLVVRQRLMAANITVLVSDRDKAELEKAGYDSDAEEGDGGSTSTSTRPGSATTAVPGTVKSAPLSTHILADVGRSLRVATVDNFQGEEAKIILLSTVRNNKQGNIGFLRMRNRVCVMLSRAKHGMYILGNRETLLANPGTPPMWPEVIERLEAGGHIGPALVVRCQQHGIETAIREPGDFEVLVGDGGCQQPCGHQLQCGHNCPRRCHVDDPEHQLIKCSKRCDRVHTQCGHACRKLCYEECGKCNVQLKEPFPLPCGHTTSNVPCWKRYEEGAIVCKVLMNITLPCGHNLEVPCCDAAKAKGDASYCTREVEVVMPVCGHTITVPCGKRSATLADPAACTGPCCALLECEHVCGRTCGFCLGRTLQERAEELTSGSLQHVGDATLRAAWNNSRAPDYVALHRWKHFLSPSQPGNAMAPAWCKWLKGRLQEQGLTHGACTKPCERVLECGHACKETCHGKSPCGTCKEPCWISCGHSKCRKACSDPCDLCALPCTWECDHQGACTAPCGAPCDRLPCDQRCSKVLPCGHRCPGLCGEPCPKDLCVHSDCLAKAPESLRDQRVDLIMFKDLKELSDEDVDEDPLIRLGCGHAFMLSSLDGATELAVFYDRSREQDRWTGLKCVPAGDTKCPACPDCRSPIQGVRRYGRVLKKAALDLVDRKYMTMLNRQLHGAHAHMKNLDIRVTELTKVVEKTSGAGVKLGELMDAAAAAWDLVVQFDKICQSAVRSPKARLYEAALARIQRLQEEQDQEQGAAAAAAAAADAGRPDAGGDQGTSTASSDMSHSGPESNGHGAGASGIHAGSSTHAGGVMGNQDRVLAAWQAWEMTRLMGDAAKLSEARIGILDAARMCLTALTAAAKILQASGGKKDMRSVKKAVKRVQTRAGDCAVIVAPRDASGATITSLAGDWVTAAQQGKSYTSAFKLLLAAMQLQVAVVRQRSALDIAVRALGLPAPEREEAVQGLLRELKQVQALAAHGAPIYAAYADGRPGLVHADYTKIQDFAATVVPQVEKEVREGASGDLLSILAAAMGYSSPAEAVSYMRGHLYRCPNGHLYVIGECGGAMQEGRCAECGAAIGGRSHMLRGDNQAALDVVTELAGRHGGRA